MSDRGEAILSAIYDDVDHKLNPSGDECWHCGGEGYTYYCIDGCCEDPESGCEDCATRCPECRLHDAQRSKAVRLAVIETGDVDVAIAWLKQIGRWNDGITRQQVEDEIKQAALAAG